MIFGLIALLGLGALATGFFLGGCSVFPGGWSDSTPPWAESPREQYVRSLEEAGLAATALGQTWLAAGHRALERPVDVQPPYRETVFFDPAEPDAVGFRLDLRRGQRLVVEVTAEGESAARGGASDRPAGPPSRRFVDLFAAARTPVGEPRRLAWSEDARELERTIREDGSVLLRLQPELLTGGRYTVTVQVEPSLVFPVEGKDSEAVGSFFGDPRDGGRRRHRGVDIFAPRGTPALAAADGRVLRVGTNRLGGKTVWLYAEGQGLTFYYAHLDRQDVERGERLRAGEPLGRVGNTGNARSTPPHLHFGVFDGRALDPWPFLHRPPGEPPELAVDPSRLGAWWRTVEAGASLRTAPHPSATRLAELARWTALEVRAGHSAWLRVELPDGRRGYLHSRLIEPASEPLRRVRLDRATLLRRLPSPQAPALAEAIPGEKVGVLGEAADALYVQAAAGPRGWIRRTPGKPGL